MSALVAGRDTAAPVLSPDGSILIVSIPLTVRRRGGRRRVVSPTCQPDWAPPTPHVDNALVKALARAFRWRKLLERGLYTSSDELAAAEKINPSYVGRVLRLTLLAPDVVEAILEGQQTEKMMLACLFKPFPLEWEKQRVAFR